MKEKGEGRVRRGSKEDRGSREVRETGRGRYTHIVMAQHDSFGLSGCP